MSQTAHKFDPTILREYDIRGVVGDTLHVADARAIGRAFGTMVKRNGGKRVALGYDGRLSSPELARACSEGLTSTGIASPVKPVASMTTRSVAFRPEMTSYSSPDPIAPCSR